MKQIKTFCLLAVGALAMITAFASASASAATFTAGKVGATLTTSMTAQHVLTITGSPAECEKVEFKGVTDSLDSESLLVHPTYEECIAFGFQATVTVNNCKFTLKSNGTFALLKTNTAGEACSLIIKVKVPFGLAECEVTIGEQSIAGAVTYSNGPGDYVVKFNGSANIADKVLKSSGLCPLTVGLHPNAHYSGETTVQAAGTSVSFDA
jgi:hypothetical protein